MKKILMLIAILAITATSYAQNYDWAVGVRIGGYTSGVTVKHNFSAANSIEGILSIPYKGGFLVTGLYERNIPVISKGFNFYYGGGAHIGSWGKYDSFRIGIDGIIGLEYKFDEIPLALSLDYKPSLDIASVTKFHLASFGLGVKIVF